MVVAYRSRVADRELAVRLRSAGAVVIEGPKACGKTATARQVAASEVLLDVDRQARAALAVDPSLVLPGATPRLIDEWQVAPEIWNHVRRAVDDRSAPGQFILTGSAVPADDVTRHTGAGRISRLRMRPMSLLEVGSSTGDLSLSALLDGQSVSCPDPGLTVHDIARLVAVGGWPGNLDYPTDRALDRVRDYLDEIRRVDIGRVGPARHDPVRVARLLRALARNIATYASASTLAVDAGGADGALDNDTARQYLTALERLMIVEDLPAWSPHLRSRSTLRSRAKRHLVDPSLAVASVGGNPDRLLADVEFLGFLFESLVVRDLRIYAQANGAQVLQYRDNTGLEVDAVVEATDGRWAAFEVKLGQRMIDEAAANLLRFRDRVDTGKLGEPAALVVVVGFGYGYRRDDGVTVLPIGALGP